MRTDRTTASGKLRVIDAGTRFLCQWQQFISPAPHPASDESSLLSSASAEHAAARCQIPDPKLNSFEDF